MISAGVQQKGLRRAIANAATTAQLDVYYEERWVGTLSDTDPLSFEYSNLWLKSASPFALPGVPLKPGRQDNAEVSVVFENLLPEGVLRDYLGRQRHLSTTFSLLQALAGDTAGGLSIVAHGNKPRRPEYEKISWKKLAALLNGERAIPASDIHAKDARISLSGAQQKVLIALDPNGDPMLPRGESPSTHIVKPDIKALPKVHHSAVNETIVMLTAAKAGLQTAEVFYEPTTCACIVKRFDRSAGERHILRLLQYDFCQLASTTSERKYEADGGPGVTHCTQLIREYSVQPARDLDRLLEWIFFNLCVGNNDAHAKNLSIYHSQQGGALLTPFYDLMCTRAYPGLSGRFAMTIGGENRPGNIGRKEIVRMAQDLEFRSDYVLHVAERVAARIEPALKEAHAAVEPLLPHSGKIITQRLVWRIARIAGQTRKRMLSA